MIKSVTFDECVAHFENAVDKDGSRLNMYGLSVQSGTSTYSYSFGREATVADLRSVSKVVTALVLGNVVERRVAFSGDPLSLESKVLDYLEPSEGLSISDRWSSVKIKHLMSNTIGHEEGFLFRKDIGDLREDQYLDYVFSSPIPYEPGTHFSYSNVGPFLVSAVLQRLTGRSLFDLALETVLDPLGISATWRNFDRFTAGSTGLRMSCNDLLKLATVLRDKGECQGSTVVSPDWVAEMTRTHSLTPKMYDPSRVFPKYSYGLGVWVCENGSFYCDGTNGQYLIVVPDLDLAIATTGEQADMKSITRCMLPLLR
jgi:CubicO group peptidase (beta-lactamase class C family)